MKDEVDRPAFRGINLFIRERLLSSRPLDETQLFFLKERFRTGNLRLAELGITVPLNPYQFYKFERATNVFEKEEQICQRYPGMNPKIHSDYSMLNGLCIRVPKKTSTSSSIGNIIVVKKNLHEPTAVYTLGHEDGHFIWEMGLSYVLYREYNVPEDIRTEIKDTEDFAMFCGNIAMANAKYDLNKIITVTPFPELTEKENHARSMAIELFPELFYGRLFRRRNSS